MTNLIGNKYIIRKARIDDLDLIMEFIKNHWNKNHVFTYSTELFIWQHKENKMLNFFIAINHKGELCGLLGIIPLSHFDNNLKNHDMWGAIWKVREGEDFKLGTKIYDYYRVQEKPQSYGSIGINKMIKKFYHKVLKQKVGHLSHYYILNCQTKKFNIAKIPKDYILDKTQKYNNSIIENVDIKQKSICVKSTYKPQKSITYLINRYYKHPFYNYKFWGIYNKKTVRAIFITRTISIGKSKCIRIVDMFGEIENLPPLHLEFQKLLEKEECEYIDCLNAGISSGVFTHIGFSKLDFNGDIVIPHYFEPFIRKNVRIDYAVDSQYDNYVIFKGDSDQDRLNILN